MPSQVAGQKNTTRGPKAEANTNLSPQSRHRRPVIPQTSFTNARNKRNPRNFHSTLFPWWPICSRRRHGILVATSVQAGRLPCLPPRQDQMRHTTPTKPLSTMYPARHGVHPTGFPRWSTTRHQKVGPSSFGAASLALYVFSCNPDDATMKLTSTQQTSRPRQGLLSGAPGGQTSQNE